MNNLIKYFLDIENQLILHEIQKIFLSNSDELKSNSFSDVSFINSNLLLTDEINIAVKVHKEFINSLIRCYIETKFPTKTSELNSIFYSQNIFKADDFIKTQIDKLSTILEDLHISFLNSEFSFVNKKLIRKKSKHHIRKTGAIYTLKEITSDIVKNSIERAIQLKTDPEKITCLDFASGTGRFYFEAMAFLKKKYNLSLQDIVCNNLFAIDIDVTALSILRFKIISLFHELNFEIIQALSKNIITRNAIIPKATLLYENSNSIDFSIDFKEVFANGGFDVIFSNPPYCLLKVNKKVNGEEKLNGYYSDIQNKIQDEIHFFRTSGVYKYALDGMLNYYQLSLEMILRFTKKNGQIGIICPSSLFADLTTTKLRKHILSSHKLHSIRYYPESARLFENVSQSTVIFFLQKNGITDKILIELSNNTFEINFETIKRVFPTNFEIPLIDQIGWKILAKLAMLKKMKEFSFLRNRRGELDLTFFKFCITRKNTGWRLVRGNMISKDNIINKNEEYVDIESFLNKKTNDFKINDYNKKRLVCQQISNVDVQKRLKFVFCEENDIIGNSCNYIVSIRTHEDLEKLFFILNSKLLNWRFKITSSNNHINNYELDELPIIELDSFELQSFSNNEIENERLICQLYNLSEEETNYILNKI